MQKGEFQMAKKTTYLKYTNHPTGDLHVSDNRKAENQYFFILN